GDAPGAIAAYQAATALDPRHGEAHVHRADLLAAAGRPDEAIAGYRTAITITPGVALLHAKFGGLLLRAGDFAAAETELREAARLNPKSAVVHLTPAPLAAPQGNPDGGIAESR